MIDVMKRLAEIDAKHTAAKPKTLSECGVMPEMVGGGNTPASISITAGNGQELSGMLKDIMSLAGVHKVEPEHMGAEAPAAVMSTTPAIAVGTSDGEDMRSVMDKLNPEMGDEQGEEETDEEYDNTPNDPTDVQPYDKEGVGPNNHENPMGAAKGRGNLNNPRAASMEESLMADYQNFVSEGKDDWEAEKKSKEPTAAEKAESDKLKKTVGEKNKADLDKVSSAFAKKKAD